MLLFSSHPPPSAHYPVEGAETADGLSVFRDLLSSKLKMSAEFQPDLPARLGLLGGVLPKHNPHTYLPNPMGATPGLRSQPTSLDETQSQSSSGLGKATSLSPFVSRIITFTCFCVCLHSTWSNKRRG